MYVVKSGWGSLSCLPYIASSVDAARKVNVEEIPRKEGSKKTPQREL